MAKKTFKEQYDRLEEIVKLLAEEQKDIDNSIELFKEGIELYKQCEAKLNEAQKEVTKLTTTGQEENYEEEN
ncbi:MAG: exodeoxyribonuclease VII small subunit [Mycoplasmatales bacterium]